MASPRQRWRWAGLTLHGTTTEPPATCTALRRRSAAGLGSHLLNWAAGEVGRRHRQWLRLDCVALNRRLCQYYESHGFRHRGDVQVGGPPGHRDDAAFRILVSRYELRA
ncbi:MAG: hypothetical protein M3Y48_04380 [Actinomycetota bacterium]|nr:hypothetical protein [Actinomycetota bacterium]